MSQDTDLLHPPLPEDVIGKLRELVESDAGATLDASTLQICASALIGQLKAFTRDAALVTKARKDLTNVSRQEIDQAYLELQNLQYEKRHLEREIEKCRQFACVHISLSILAAGSFAPLGRYIRIFHYMPWTNSRNWHQKS